MASAPFPRGGAGASAGASAGTSSISRKIDTKSSIIASDDNLFGKKRLRNIEIVPSAKSKKKSKKSDASAVAVDTPAATPVGLGQTKTSIGNKVVHINALTFNQYQVGTIVLGYVLSIHHEYITVSLPGGLTGTVSSDEISDSMHKIVAKYRASPEHSKKRKTLENQKPDGEGVPKLNQLVSLHQPVLCMVASKGETGMTSHKGMKLTMRSSLIHRGTSFKNLSLGVPLWVSVSSVEDHGYVLDCGVSDAVCFLPNKSKPGQAVAHFSVGQPILCVVDALNDTSRTVTVKVGKKAFVDGITRGTQLAFKNLGPGMQVHCVVEHILETGLIVKFLSSFYGVIDPLSLPKFDTNKNWKSCFTTGDVILARIVFIDYGAKACRLSMRPHVMELRAPANLIKLGTMLEDLSVILSRKKIGIRACTVEAGTDNALDIADTTADTAGSKKKSAKLAALQRQRELDENVCGVFIHRSTLAHRSKVEADAAFSSAKKITEDGDGDKETSDLDENDDDDREQPNQVDDDADDPAAENENEPINPTLIESRYRVGSTIPRARVSGYHLVEGIYIASNLPSAIRSEADIVHWSQVKVGQVVPVTIQQVKETGIVVMINGKVKAMCPRMHTSDVVASASNDAAVMKLLRQKFKVGQVLKMRVWEVMPNAIIVTNKKTLVTDRAVIRNELNEEQEGDEGEPGSEPSIITSFQSAYEGWCGYGVISEVSEKTGLRIHFYNRVKGTVPVRVLIKQGIFSVSESYRVGQVVRCIVVRKFDKREADSTGNKSEFKSLLLALEIGSVEEVMSSLGSELKIIEEKDVDTPGNDEDAGHSLESTGAVSQFVSGVISGIKGKLLYVRLDDGRTAKLMQSHCFDLGTTSNAIFAEGAVCSAFDVGCRIERALILDTDKQGIPIITLKPLLLSAATDVDGISLPSSVSELLPGNKVAGYVVKIDNFGILVRFRRELTALAPRSNLADKFISASESLSGLFHEGDSVLCVVQKVDHAKNRVIVSFRPSLNGPSQGPACYTARALAEKFVAHALVPTTNSAPSTFADTVQIWSRYSIGSQVLGTVQGIKSYGVVFVAPDHSAVFVARGEHAVGTSPVKVGDQVPVRILDVDYAKSVYEVSMASDLLLKSTKKGKKQSSSTQDNGPVLSVGESTNARVELVQDEYLVASVSKPDSPDNRALVVVGLRDFHCPYLATSEYSVHDSIDIKIIHISKSSPLATAATFDAYYSPHNSLAVGSLANQIINVVKAPANKTAAELRKELFSNLKVGKIIRWVVQSITATEVRILPANHSRLQLSESNNEIHGILHVSNAIAVSCISDNLEAALKKSKSNRQSDLSPLPNSHPFAHLEIGHTITGKILYCTSKKLDPKESKQTKRLKTSEDTDGAAADEDVNTSFTLYVGLACGDDETNVEATQGKWSRFLQWTGKNGIKANETYSGVVTAVPNQSSSGDQILARLHCTVSLSPHIHIPLHYIDISSKKSLVKLFSSRCFVGQPILVNVTALRSVSSGSGTRYHASISRTVIEDSIIANDALLAEGSLPSALTVNAPKPLKAGQLVNGILDLSNLRIPRPPAIMVSLPQDASGRVCLTELTDAESFADFSEVFSFLAANRNGKIGAESVNPPCELPTGHKHGDIVRCRILSISTESNGNRRIELSLRPSRVETKDKAIALADDALPAEGSLVNGFVATVSSSGCFVRVSHDITGCVLMKDLSDVFVPNPSEEFPIGKLVQARVISASTSSVLSSAALKLSLKRSVVQGDDELVARFNAFAVGAIVEGIVKTVNDIGVFVELKEKSRGQKKKSTAAEQVAPIVGLARKIHAVNKESIDLHEKFAVGDVVQCKILSVNAANRKISLGLKPSYFTSVEEENEDEPVQSLDNSETETEDGEDEYDEEEGDASDDDEEDMESGDESNIKMLGYADDDSDDDDDDIRALLKSASVPIIDDEDDEDAEVAPVKSKSTSTTSSTIGKRKFAEENGDEDDTGLLSGLLAGSKATAKVAGASAPSLFQWSDFGSKLSGVFGSTQRSGDESDSDDDNVNVEAEVEATERKGNTKVSKREEEEMIRATESALVNGTLVPQKPDDFERLLLASPNSSYLWIQFMAYCLRNIDIAGARKVADRALKSINFREEDEKMNVWLALLNAELKYGDTESFDAAFRRAIVESKGKLIHLQMAEIFEKENNITAAESMFERALKKYKYSKKVWSAYQLFQLRQKKVDAAKQLLSRSLQSLSKHKHVEVITRFACAEYDFGSVDRGRVLFEELLSSYPKRFDLWNVYVDKEIKAGCFAHARALFERMTASKQTTKNMKSVFKKFLAFEVQHGTITEQNAVKTRAREYVASLM